jgi:hypothetical protein
MVLADGARPIEDAWERLSKVAQEFERECNRWVITRERPDWILVGVVTRERNGVNLDALEEESWLPTELEWDGGAAGGVPVRRCSSRVAWLGAGVVPVANRWFANACALVEGVKDRRPAELGSRRACTANGERSVGARRVELAR